ncbi:hypothetical protein M2T78_19160 [Elizabethkingia ursingii]|uniref:hypothetical protein n=1 Tax=Elizabethkingia ursingii TaxID=1756150 RepID=UPI002013A20F|nr:hypothetical protein [Elizabethkingia ursingii]MCL1666390.1 hypothetical protein [Elizabethkingia ursingii]
MAKNDSIDITNIVNVGIYISELTGKIEEAQAKVKTFKDEINSLNEAGQQISKLGSTLTDYLTKPILGALSATTGIASAFNALQSSLSINMERVGEVINKNFDISGIAEKLAGYIDKVVTVFENLDPAIQKGILGFVGLLAAVGPILEGIGSFIGFTSTLIAGVEGIGAALAALATPVGLVTVGLVGVVTAVVANWGKIKPYIIDTVNYFIRLYNESIVVRAGVEFIALAFKNSFAIIGGIITTAWELFKTFAKGTADLFKGVGGVLEGAFTADVGKMTAGIKQIFSAQIDTVKIFGRDLINGFSDVYDKVRENIIKAEDNILNVKKRPYITDIGFGFSADSYNRKSDNIKKGNTGISKIDSVASNNITNTNKDQDNTLLPDLIPLDMPERLDWESSMLKMREDLYNKHAEEIQKAIPGLTTSYSEAQLTIDTMNDKIGESWGNILGSGISDGISGFFETMGSSIAGGGNVVNELGKALLGTIGDIAIQLGKSAIGIGVGMLAIKAAFKNPFTAIAAGIALVAIGSFIKGSVSKIPEGGGSSGDAVSTSAGANVQSYSSSYSSSGGSSGGEVVFRISGNDLIGVLDREADRRKRLGGG